MTSHFRASMKMLTTVITLTTLLCFLAGQVCSDPPRRSRCHQVNCPPGYGISGPCFVDEPPPVCKACTNGTFSSHSSRSAKCRPCRRCDPEREMVLWQCSPTLDTVCVKYRRRLDDGNEFVVRPRILMQKPIDSHVIADIYNKSRQEHAERERKRQELERLRAENMTFDSNVTENTGDFGIAGHEFSTEMDITTSSLDATVAKIDTISKTSHANDKHFTTSLLNHLTVVTIEDPGIDLEEDDGTPGQIHRSTTLYIAIISTAIFFVVIAVLTLLIIWLRRARLIMRTTGDECRGSPSDANTANVTNRENGSCLVVSLDVNGEVTTGVIGKSNNPASNYLPPITLDTGEDGQFSTCHGSDVSSKRVQDVQLLARLLTTARLP
ncbi:uncharacterized protein [Ptychodera flava]|uniref:uncharacterized protein n=1 Tax=Ptychodera flava TaxID=63121 RepID=UPI00396A6358